jgi:ABC-type transport system involved in cytochrome bd biosynthesis fused ATPase/permease subunit
MGSQIEESEFPSMSVSRQMHSLTHNVYYPMGIVISEFLMLFLLVPFIFFISFKGSLLVFGITLLLSIPSLRIVRKKIQVLIEARNKIDYEVDKISYTKYRVHLDQGESSQGAIKLRELMHLASQLDRKIVKLGSYSRFTIEFSFIVAIISAFIFIDELVSPSARIQFFAVLAYSFFRIIPSFSRIMSARNQLSSFDAEFQEIYKTRLLFSIREDENVEYTEFFTSIEFDYSDHHFSPKNISLEMGDFVLIQGVTGVGKTTLLKSIAGIKSENFSIKIDGGRVVLADTWKPKVAIVSQQPFLVGNSLLEMVTGHDDLEAVDLPRYNLALSLSCLSESIEKTRFSLTNEGISGGERKQIALARAIYSDSTILLLDELTAGMDQQLSIDILSNLMAWSKKGITLMTSHDPAIEKFFTQVIRLSRD